MAQRRMFSQLIVDSDAFLDMPPTSQILYFHLCMRADDDGFVGGPKKIMRMIGSSEDDLKVLLAKRFIIQFESGVIVIKHWKIHNYIQNDRYHETKYIEEKSGLTVKENGAYTECIQDGYKMDTEASRGKARLGKARLGKREDAPLTPAQSMRLFVTSEEMQTLAVKSLVDKGAPEDIARKEINKFILYWTERNKSGTKEKWELQETFDVGRRLATWFSRVRDFNGFQQDKVTKV